MGARETAIVFGGGPGLGWALARASNDVRPHVAEYPPWLLDTVWGELSFWSRSTRSESSGPHLEERLRIGRC
jgi:hypothetical protein